MVLVLRHYGNRSTCIMGIETSKFICSNFYLNRRCANILSLPNSHDPWYGVICIRIFTTRCPAVKLVVKLSFYSTFSQRVDCGGSLFLQTLARYPLTPCALALTSQIPMYCFQKLPQPWTHAFPSSFVDCFKTLSRTHSFSILYMRSASCSSFF